MLLKEFEHCAVPVIPEKYILERTLDNNSPFVKERARKLRHFISIIFSHPHLMKSKSIRTFLTENDEVFIDNRKKEIESINQKEGKGLFSYASDSFKSLYKKATEINYSKLLYSM